ncbi:MAG: MFS transporter [Proteobacteria bacterium]|nr:MFS transporter [Pseudomonadota bacterium]
MNKLSSSSAAHLSGLSFGIWGLVICYVIYQFILRVSLGVMAPDLMERFMINATEFSLLGSIFYFGYASMQIPVGIFLDHFGPLKTIPLFLCLCVTGFCFFTFSENWTIVLLGRLLTGIGSAGAFISSLKVSNMLFPDRLSKLFVGITSSLGLLGAVCGGLIGFLLSVLSLQTLLEGLSIAGLILTAVILLSFSLKKTRNLLQIKEVSHIPNENLLVGITKIFFKKPVLIILMASVGLMTTALYTFADSWGPSFLIQVHHLSMDQAATSIFLIYIGMVTGCSLLSFVGNHFNNTNGIIVLCGLITAGILGFLLFFSAIPYFILLALMFILGLCASLQILFFGVILSLVPKKFGGVTSGLTNMIIMLLGSGSISLMGLLMDYAQETKILHNGVPVYSTYSYRFAFGTITILVLLGAFSFAILTLIDHFKRKKTEGPVLL